MVDPVSQSSLRKFLQAPIGDQGGLTQLVTNLYRPRILVVPDVALTAVLDHAGALLRFTSAAAVTVTLPAGIFEAGYNFSFLQYGAGTITFASAGTILTGIHSQRNVIGGAVYLDTGEWLLTGTVA